jgi:hypothetical protein
MEGDVKAYFTVVGPALLDPAHPRFRLPMNQPVRCSAAR